MMSLIREGASSMGFTASVLHHIELACEEALVNVIRHGYPAHHGHIIIQCQSSTATNGIEVTISDDGVPFNPLENIKRPPRGEKLETLGLGGYGIYMIVKLMDKVEYHRSGNLNTLVLIKHIIPESQVSKSPPQP